MNNPKITIAVPVYGVEKYIEKCATSLFEQTYSNIEYVFVNDCTKDRSIEILQEVANRYPARKPFIHIIQHHKNRGISAARNTGVSASTGKFIMHVDSDDYIEINTIELAVKRQQETEADIVSFNACAHKPRYNEYYNHPHYSSPKEMAVLIISQKAPISIWGRLIRLSLYKDNNINTEEGTNMGDDYQVSPILAYYAKKVSTLNKTLYHYNCTNISSSTYSFSENISNQTWRSVELLNLFFQHKEKMFIDALEFIKIKLIAEHITICCQNDMGRKYYLFLRNKLKNTDKNIWKKLSLERRIILYLTNFPLLKAYVSIATCVNFHYSKLCAIIYKYNNKNLAN